MTIWSLVFPRDRSKSYQRSALLCKGLGRHRLFMVVPGTASARRSPPAARARPVEPLGDPALAGSSTKKWRFSSKRLSDSGGNIKKICMKIGDFTKCFSFLPIFSGKTQDSHGHVTCDSESFGKRALNAVREHLPWMMAVCPLSWLRSCTSESA